MLCRRVTATLAAAAAASGDGFLLVPGVEGQLVIGRRQQVDERIRGTQR